MIDTAQDLWRQELSPVELSHRVDVSWVEERQLVWDQNQLWLLSPGVELQICQAQNQDCSAEHHLRAASKLAHHLGELSKSMMRGVVTQFQVSTFILTSGHIQELCHQHQFLRTQHACHGASSSFLADRKHEWRDLVSPKRETCTQFSLQEKFQLERTQLWYVECICKTRGSFEFSAAVCRLAQMLRIPERA